MKLPAIIVNFKVYEQATGEDAMRLAQIHQKVADETGASLGIAVNAVDLRQVAASVSIPVFAQHLDAVSYGSHTGKLAVELIKDAGAYGVILNHAEYPLGLEVLKRSVMLAKEAGLYTLVCADTPESAKVIAGFGPDLIAVEPPELIGGDVSVSKVGPRIIEEAVQLVGDNVLVGAGIKDPEDVQIALALGARGVLLASGVVKAADPYLALMDLVSGLKAN